MAVSNLSREELLAIANKNGVSLTEKEINEVVDVFNHEEECDPNSAFENLVLFCIKQIKK